MKFAILLWIYKDARLSCNRAQLLRKYNPDTPIYVLFGGDPALGSEFQHILSPIIDDFYCYDADASADWKWRNGDALIREWFRGRRHLPFDMLVVAQWDLLLLRPVRELFGHLGTNDIILSSTKNVDSVFDSWYWVSDPVERTNYDRFRTHLSETYGYAGPILCCHFVVACLPRSFLEKLLEIANFEIGFLEYKIPTYARVFGYNVVSDPRYDTGWSAPGQLHRRTARLTAVLTTAQDYSVPLPYLFVHLAIPGGARAFHPVREEFPLSWPSRLRETFRYAGRFLRRAVFPNG